MTDWKCSDVQGMTGGRWLQRPPGDAPVIGGLSIDSRTIRSGELFLALRGDRFDGHDFLGAAAAAGAALLVIDRPQAAEALPDVPVLAVDDALAALHALARGHRDRLARASTMVIAVGGSNGKTTTRHLIHAVLSASLTGTQSPRSFNNEIGVPLTLLAADPGDDFVVAEIGTSRPGEIARLAKLVSPDAAVLTSLGAEHLAWFGDLDGVRREEAALLEHVRPGGPLFMPVAVRDDLAAAGLLEGMTDLAGSGRATRLVTWGRECDAEVALRWGRRRPRPDGRGQSFVLDGSWTIDLSLLGEHNVSNAAAAVAVGRWLHVPDDRIATALGAASGVPMRLQVHRFGDRSRPAAQVVVLDDSYNANATSMAGALSTLGELAAPNGGRRVAVLGDMLELGAASAACHQGTVAALAEADRSAGRVDIAVLVGPESARAASWLRRRWPAERVQAFAAWHDDLPETVASLLRPGDIVLLKASRGLGLERLIPAVEARFASP